MADLTAQTSLRVLGEAYTEKWIMDTTAAHVVYMGTPMFMDQSVDTENVAPFISTLEVETNDVFIGIAAENKSVTIGAIENTEIELYMFPTVLGFYHPTVFTSDVDCGKAVYMEDSGLMVGVASVANHPYIGRVHRVIGDYVYVALSRPFININAG